MHNLHIWKKFIKNVFYFYKKIPLIHWIIRLESKQMLIVKIYSPKTLLVAGDLVA